MQSIANYPRVGGMYNDVIIKRRISAVSKERNPCALVVMDMKQ